MSAYRVLIVEDHPFQHEYLINLFQAIGGFDVDVVWDGAAALQRLARQRYDLLLSDLMMPGMDGVQLIQHLAQMQTPPTLALMSVASRRMLACAGQVAENLGLTVAGLISKPLREPEVLILRDCLDKLAEHARTPCCHRGVSHSRENLVRALANGEIQAWFQPKKSLHDGRIVGAEALARWVHPVEGLLMPCAFLGDIERLGLEAQLLTCILGQTLSAQTQWAQLGYRMPVSINLPTHLLDQCDLVDHLLAQVQSRDAEPRQITFELMESSTTQLPSNYYAGACRLRMMGFGLAMDDFGKGFSSYYNLVSTPFNEVKIDRSLVHGCAENESLTSALQSIVELCRKLGLTAIAEGAETQAELAILRRIRCDQVQGFLISQAVAAEKFSALLIEDGPAPALI